MKVRALQPCFIDNKYRNAGDEFEYRGEINPDVMMPLSSEEPVDKPTAKKAKKAKAVDSAVAPPEAPEPDASGSDE